MKSWRIPAAAVFALVVGLSVPAFALTNVSAWETVQNNPGTNCTIGRATLNNTAGTGGATVRSKSYCSEFASDVNLPAGRMGVSTEVHDDNGNLCGSSNWVDNAASTASKSVAATVYCTGTMHNLGWERRLINATDYVLAVQAPDPLYFP